MNVGAHEASEMVMIWDGNARLMRDWDGITTGHAVDSVIGLGAGLLE